MCPDQSGAGAPPDKTNDMALLLAYVVENTSPQISRDSITMYRGGWESRPTILFTRIHYQSLRMLAVHRISIRLHMYIHMYKYILLIAESFEYQPDY